MALTPEERIAKLEMDAHNFSHLLELQEKTIDRRFKELKDEVHDLRGMAASIERLAVNIENMQKGQDSIIMRLNEIEKEPAEDNRYYKRTAIACVITGIITALISAGIALLNNI